MRPLFLLLVVLGAALPYSQLIPFLAEHGLDVPRMIDQLFATPISSFFGLDVIVSALAVLSFVALEHQRLGAARTAACVAATLAIGPSCGLPLLLFFRSGRSTSPGEAGDQAAR